jgi:hypothetical protein
MLVAPHNALVSKSNLGILRENAIKLFLHNILGAVKQKAAVFNLASSAMTRPTA